jgi:hypothetical protein
VVWDNRADVKELRAVRAQKTIHVMWASMDVIVLPMDVWSHVETVVVEITASE